MQENFNKHSLRAALLQFDVRPGEVQHNEAVISALLDESKACGAQLVVLPELWNVGYDLPHLPQLAQNLRQGSSARLLMRKAKEHDMYIFGGTIAEKKVTVFLIRRWLLIIMVKLYINIVSCIFSRTV